MFHKDGGSNFSERSYNKRQILVGEKKFYLKDGKYAELSKTERERESLDSDNITSIYLRNIKESVPSPWNFLAHYRRKIHAANPCPIAAQQNGMQPILLGFLKRLFLQTKKTVTRLLTPSYEYLFNSYYNSVGKQYPRANRGLITHVLH